VHNRDQQGDREICAEKRGGGFMACLEAAGLTQPEIDRNEHQARAMGDRHHE
jgi:hypothetical protein